MRFGGSLETGQEAGTTATLINSLFPDAGQGRRDLRSGNAAEQRGLEVVAGPALWGDGPQGMQAHGSAVRAGRPPPADKLPAPPG